MLRRKPITPKQIDAILAFLDAIERMDFKFGEWPVASETPVTPHFKYGDPLEAFVRALYGEGWIEQFDWEKWQENAAQYVDSPDLLASADAETIRKLLTTHIRKDRFCEGHLAAMFENGHIVALLRRLKEIRADNNYKNSASEAYGRINSSSSFSALGIKVEPMEHEIDDGGKNQSRHKDQHQPAIERITASEQLALRRSKLADWSHSRQDH